MASENGKLLPHKWRPHSVEPREIEDERRGEKRGREKMPNSTGGPPIVWNKPHQKTMIMSIHLKLDLVKYLI